MTHQFYTFVLLVSLMLFVDLMVWDFDVILRNWTAAAVMLIINLGAALFITNRISSD